MAANQQKSKGRPGSRNLWMMVSIVVGVIAIVRELQMPPDQRTWHGKVGFVPYEFRRPTLERFRQIYWNEDGPIVSSQLWGVGWALNVGAIKKRVAG
jgi:hypothetical protein